MLVEQALFTSARTDQGDGYQLVSTSPGLLGEDADALRIWCPSHGALLDRGPATGSVNFHPLPSGAWCVSRTMLAGMEYSERNGERVATHCLIVPPEVLARFANNPFAVLRAAVAAGVLDSSDPQARIVPAFQIVGRASVLERQLVESFASTAGVPRLAHLVAVAIAEPVLGLEGMVATESLVAVLLNCLPVECRTQFSFSTGLVHSPRRPFRLLGLPHDAATRTQLQRQFGVVPLDLAGEYQRHLSPSSLEHPWADFVAEHVTGGQLADLVAWLMQPRPDLTLADLATAIGTGGPLDASWCSQSATRVAHAHLAHQRFTSATAATLDVRPSGPAQSSLREATVDVALLEELDDAVYDAIALKPGAFPRMVELWPQVLAQLDPKAIEESRERYLAYALGIWNAFVRENAHPDRAVVALDVMEALGG